LPGRAPPRPYLCDQQDQPPLQGAPGLILASDTAGQPSPKAVIFDIGNVLYDWDPRYLYAKLIPDRSELNWFLTHVVTKDWHFQHDAGRSSADTIAELRAAFPAYGTLIDAYVPRWLETIPGPMPGMIALVETLAADRVPLFSITNFSAEFWPRFRAAAPVFERFRGIVVSGVERITKPDPSIYALALARFGPDAEHAVFIDDRADNVDAAIAAGLRGHVFVDAATTRRFLHHQGLL